MQWLYGYGEAVDEKDYGLRPTVFTPGQYKFRREPYDVEVEMEDPTGNTYIFHIISLVPFLRRFLKMPEEAADKLADMVYEFHGIIYDTKLGRFWIFRDPVDESL